MLMRLEQEDILRRFQEWLAQTNQELEQLEDEPWAAEFEARAPESATAIGLLPLVEAFTALRHELKLQTKSARGTEDALQTALAGLDRAIEHFGNVEPQEQAAAEKAARPLVEALIGLDEAMRRGAQAVAAAQRRLTEVTPQRLVEQLEQRFAQRSFWQRWRSRSWHADVIRCCRQVLAETQGPVLASLGDGYQLICARLQRTLAEHRIERMKCAGQSVDPTRMNVVELVDVLSVAPETVVDEIRPGYLWQGYVMRFAEVRATRPAPHVEETVIPEPVEDADSDPSFDEHDADEEAWPDPGDQEQEEMRAET
jgi:molecular chaperone GrpE